MSKRTVDIIEDFINTLDLTGNILSSSDDTVNTFIVVDNPFHARKGMPVFIDGNETSVVAIDYNTNTITVAGVYVSPSSFSLNSPFYFHGTPIATNNHISQAQANQKYPMIYLYEIFQEVDQDIYSNIDWTANIRLFFLDQSNFEDWSTDDHYTYVINGQNNLVDAFIAQINKSHLFKQDEETYTRTNHANFGVFVENQGHTTRFFDDYLSGVQVQFTLNVRKCCNC